MFVHLGLVCDLVNGVGVTHTRNYFKPPSDHKCVEEVDAGLAFDHMLIASVSRTYKSLENWPIIDLMGIDRRYPRIDSIYPGTLCPFLNIKGLIGREALLNTLFSSKQNLIRSWFKKNGMIWDI